MWIFRVLLLLLPIAATAETAQEIEALLSAPPAPLDLAIAVDDGAAQSQVIGAKGGTLELRNAEGDRFVLTFPEGALLTDTRITATPITEGAGLPEGAGKLVGVILEPDGLELARTATLEITPAAAIPLEDRLHWGFYGQGSDAFLHLAARETDRIVIPIDHFSGAGVSFADRINLQLDRWKQASLLDRLRTQAALLVREVNAGRASMDAVVNLLVEGRRGIEVGQTAIANRPGAICSDITNALSEIMGAERVTGLFGLEGGSEALDRIAGIMNARVSTCLEEALQVCLATGDLTVLVKFGVLYERMRALLGMTGEGDVLDPAMVAAIRAAMERCGRYKLTVRASGRWEDEAGVYGTAEYTIDVPIRLTFTDAGYMSYILEGEAGPTSHNVTFVDYACWKLDAVRVDAPMLARLRNIEFRKDNSPLRVEVSMRPLKLTEVVSCNDSSGEQEAASVIWEIAHQRELAGSVFNLRLMKPVSHPKIFRYTWEGRGSEYGVEASDTTELVLEHIGG
jgi:hypothetical protein